MTELECQYCGSRFDINIIFFASQDRKRLWCEPSIIICMHASNKNSIGSRFYETNAEFASMHYQMVSGRRERK
jgi:hypothetical protein